MAGKSFFTLSSIACTSWRVKSSSAYFLIISLICVTITVEASTTVYPFIKASSFLSSSIQIASIPKAGSFTFSPSISSITIGLDIAKYLSGKISPFATSTPLRSI